MRKYTKQNKEGIDRHTNNDIKGKPTESIWKSRQNKSRWHRPYSYKRWEWTATLNDAKNVAYTGQFSLGGNSKTVGRTDKR